MRGTSTTPRRAGAPVPDVARRQGGVFTAQQAIAEGWTPRQVRRRRAAGQWRTVLGRVLSADPGTPSAVARAWAAHLMWPDSVCILRTAANLWNLPVRDDDLAHVTGIPGREARGARIHVVPIPERDTVTRFGRLRVTTPRRTALDCLASLPFPEALDLYAWASTRDLVGRADVVAALKERVGRPGAGQLRRLLAVTVTGAMSGAEHGMHRLMSEAGLLGWQAGARIHDEVGLIGVVDILFEEARLVIEVDGERAHSGREAFIRDRNRQNRLVNAGYRVLRFTWWDLTQRPDAVVREIRQALKIPTSEAS